jgi:hypothetical protein
MEIKLSKEESEEYFYNALCNGLGYISGYGLELDNDSEYINAQKRLNDKGVKGICYEDVLMEVLRGGDQLTLVDYDGDEERFSITLDDVHNKVQKVPVSHLLDMVEERDDAVTADVILQTVFLGEVIFG